MWELPFCLSFYEAVQFRWHLVHSLHAIRLDTEEMGKIVWLASTLYLPSLHGDAVSEVPL